MGQQSKPLQTQLSKCTICTSLETRMGSVKFPFPLPPPLPSFNPSFESCMTVNGESNKIHVHFSTSLLSLGRLLFLFYLSSAMWMIKSRLFLCQSSDEFAPPFACMIASRLDVLCDLLLPDDINSVKEV